MRGGEKQAQEGIFDHALCATAMGQPPVACPFCLHPPSLSTCPLTALPLPIASTPLLHNRTSGPSGVWHLTKWQVLRLLVTKGVHPGIVQEAEGVELVAVRTEGTQ